MHMFLHNVHYWLKPGLTPEQHALFLRGIDDLVKLASVRAAWFGRPAAGGEAISERGYDYGLVMDLGDEAGHDAFQTDPAHHEIRTRIGGSWERIVIYDVAAATLEAAADA